VIERRLEKDILISESQFDFILGRSITEAIYLLRRFMELYRDKKENLHMVFIDLEKAYDRVKICLEEKEVSFAYIRVIKDMYKGVR